MSALPTIKELYNGTRKRVIFEKTTTAKRMLSSYRDKDGNAVFAKEVKDGNNRKLPYVGMFSSTRLIFVCNEGNKGIISYWLNSDIIKGGVNCGKSPFIALIDEEGIRSDTNERSQAIAVCFGSLSALSEAQVKVAGMRAGCKPTDTHGDIFTTLSNLINQNPESFTSILKGIDTKEATMAADLETFISQKLVTHGNTGFYWGDKILGKTKEEVIDKLSGNKDEWFKSLKAASTQLKTEKTNAE